MVTTPEIVILPDGRMDRANAARYLGRAKGTLAAWAIQGKGPKYIKRGRVWYRKEDLDAWLAAGEVTSSAQAQALGVQ
ncbi:helix-turn-helix domain-containing protein [Orrella sp. JC864]|uniref:helix-turn-helix transcriptional regulator n=1 Tax=Orrella sp. JC864 TaxID=3120298 RepID=UPI00300BEC1D